MPVHAAVLAELDVGDAVVAGGAQGVGDFALLPGGEEDVAGHAEDERGRVAEGGEAGC